MEAVADVDIDGNIASSHAAVTNVVEEGDHCDQWSTPLPLAGEKALVFLDAYINNPQAHESTFVALHPEVFRVSYFPQGTEVLF